MFQSLRDKDDNFIDEESILGKLIKKFNLSWDGENTEETRGWIRISSRIQIQKSTMERIKITTKSVVDLINKLKKQKRTFYECDRIYRTKIGNLYCVFVVNNRWKMFLYIFRPKEFKKDNNGIFRLKLCSIKCQRKQKNR